MPAGGLLTAARAVDSDRADAVFISCTGFRTIEYLAMLEADLGKPVISSNQATCADCLRILNVGDVAPGYGSLFQLVFAARDAGNEENPRIAAE